MAQKKTTARARTPQQLERQAEVFKLSVFERKTVREIAKELGIATKTVMEDIKAEAAVRAAEREATREHEKDVHLALIEQLLDKSYDMAGMPGTGALGSAAKAIEMRAKVLGLDAPVKVDAGLDKLVEALTTRLEDE